MRLPTLAARFKQPSFRLLVYLVAALIFAMPLRTALEHHFLYFPDRAHEATPLQVGLDFEDITFSAADGIRLNGWLVPGEDGAPVVLFCIGNAGNISHRLDTLRLLNDLGVAVFIFNYRGYGTSDGKASEAGLYADVAGAVSYLEERGWQASRMIFFGRSLGAAVALEQALQTPPAGLVMEAAFTSVAAMGRRHYPGLSHLLGWLIDAKYDNLARISRLASPLLLIHGRRDSICPPAMAEELHAAATGDKHLLWVPGADHNDAFITGGTIYRDALQKAFTQWTGFRRTARPGFSARR